MANEIWFVIGMCLTDIDMDKMNNRFVGMLLEIIFIVLSVVAYKQNITNGLVTFILGLLACVSVLWIMISCRRYNNRFMDYVAKYTMPIFLMHTLFAAPVRICANEDGINQFDNPNSDWISHKFYRTYMYSDSTGKNKVFGIRDLSE